MNRLNKTILIALAGLYCILSTLPIQQCSSTNDFFIFDCPESNINEIGLKVKEFNSCCKATPCCGKFIKDNDCKLIQVSLLSQDENTKSIYPLDYQYLSHTFFKLYDSFYLRPKPLEGGFITSSRYLLFESFLC